jgi:hypothetical protein
LASELQIVETAHPLTLGGALVANEGDRDLRLEDLIAALIGETKR